MKFQFGTKTILLVTAIVAIACGGITWFATIAYPTRRRFLALDSLLFDLIYTAPIWTPLILVAFAIGRKRLSVAMVLAFALAEGFALAIAKIALFITRGY